MRMKAPTLRVAIDVGSESHWVGVGLSEGELLEAFKSRWVLRNSLPEWNGTGDE